MGCVLVTIGTSWWVSSQRSQAEVFNGMIESRSITVKDAALKDPVVQDGLILEDRLNEADRCIDLKRKEEDKSGGDLCKVYVKSLSQSSRPERKQ